VSRFPSHLDIEIESKLNQVKVANDAYTQLCFILGSDWSKFQSEKMVIIAHETGAYLVSNLSVRHFYTKFVSRPFKFFISMLDMETNIALSSANSLRNGLDF
jgi:hypothetical protein